MEPETQAARPDRAKLVLKLRALLAKTVDNGCTEAEALLAAEKASELMEEYDLSYADVEQVRDDRYGARKRPFGGGSRRRRSYHESTMTHHAISILFDCRVWYSSGELVFFGSEHDTEAAHYMADLIRVAMDGECARYLASPERPRELHGRTLRASFMIGMAGRISTRLREMKAARTQRAKDEPIASPSGFGLVPVTSRALVLATKQQVVKERFDTYAKQSGLNLRGSVGGGRSANSGHAYHAGKAAGDRVGLNPALGGQRKQIGA